MILSCERHGLSRGNLVCEHVEAAIGAWSPCWAGAEPAATPECTRRIDRGDRSFFQAVFVCESCMTRFNLDPLGPVPDDPLSEEILEGRSDTFPSVFPACQGCLDAWLPARLAEGRRPSGR
jgi:hypothetical protein